MDWFKQRRPIANGCGWQQTQRAADHARFIADDIAKHILCQDNIKLLRIKNDLHGSIVNKQKINRNVCILFCNPLHYFSPQTRRFKNIRFIDQCQFFSSLLCRLKSKMCNTLNFVMCVNAIVRGACSLGVDLFFSEINTASQLAENNKINSLKLFVFQWRQMM